MNKFNIGDKVWYATSRNVEKRMPCADCFGKRQLTVILGDDTQVLIPCECCSWADDRDNWGGFREAYPHGYNRYYEYEVKVEEVVINRLEISQGKVEYGFNGNYRMDEDRAFLTKEEAETRALELIAVQNEEELAKVKRKEKPQRTWSWNLSYHRNCIKRAEKEIEYHSKKFEYAKTKVKEEKVLAK